jgi:hypothetical protein
MTRGSHGLLKVSPAPQMPCLSTPSEQATLETALQPFQLLPIHRANTLRPSSTPLDTLRHTHVMLMEKEVKVWTTRFDRE